MSYTIPESVDTKAQAVLAVASAIADEDKSALGDGTVNAALDVLADVLAGQDIAVPQTNAGAILALAQYATGGGGGGAQTTDVYLWNRTEDARFASILPTKVEYVTGVDFDDHSKQTAEVAFTAISETVDSVEYHGVKLTGVPAGAVIKLTVSMAPDGGVIFAYSLGGSVKDYFNDTTLYACDNVVPAPIDGLAISGSYYLVDEE